MTILEIKKLIFEKVKFIFKNDKQSDEEINKNLLLHVVDNLPYYIEGKYTKKKAVCEFCREKHL